MDTKILIKIINDYYPEGTSIDSSAFLIHPYYKKLNDKCLEAYNNKTQWLAFLEKIKIDTNFKIIDNSHILLSGINPSYCAYLISDKNDPYWLILKISVIAPVYYLYYDNKSFDQNTRFIRTNPIDDYETNGFVTVKKEIEKFFVGYQCLDFSEGYSLMYKLGDIILERRKPYLDECLFGTFISFHS